MVYLNPNRIHEYSAAFEAFCGKGIMVWRNNQFPHQNQLKDHIVECEECKKIIRECKDINTIKWYLRDYIKIK